ncbi:MAG: hypothetical protein Q9186_000689 [Xanthomendoza sp. 1 TL-2023]
MSASQSTGQAMTDLSVLFFDIDGEKVGMIVMFLDILSYIEKSEPSSSMNPRLQAQIVTRCCAQYRGDPDDMHEENIDEFIAVREQLWGSNSSESIDRAATVYMARWNGDDHDKIKEKAKTQHDFLLKEWYELKIEVGPLDEILDQKDILNTILMAKEWLEMDYADIAVTLTYLCSTKAALGGFDFQLDNDFRSVDVEYLYQYSRSFMSEDYKLWAHHRPSVEETVEMQSGEWNQRLLQMPWVSQYLGQYNTMDKEYRNAAKVGSYKLFRQWAGSAKEWNEKRQQQP